MKTRIKYIQPEIKQIDLDNEISLVLASEAPPFGPDEEVLGEAPDYFNNNHLNTFAG